MMSWSNPQPCPCLVSQEALEIQEILKALAGYFEPKWQRGKLRQMDAEVLARTLIGRRAPFRAGSAILLEDGDSSSCGGMFVRGSPI